MQFLIADTFTATTANMTPAGVNLRIQILEWQEADARAEVVATLAAGADAATPLGKHAQEIYKAFDAAGHGGVDFSGIIQHVRSLAGK